MRKEGRVYTLGTEYDCIYLVYYRYMYMYVRMYIYVHVYMYVAMYMYVQRIEFPLFIKNGGNLLLGCRKRETHFITNCSLYVVCVYDINHMYMYIHVHICTYVRTYNYTCICSKLYVRTYVRTTTCTCTYIHVRTCNTTMYTVCSRV